MLHAHPLGGGGGHILRCSSAFSEGKYQSGTVPPWGNSKQNKERGSDSPSLSLSHTDTCLALPVTGEKPHHFVTLLCPSRLPRPPSTKTVVLPNWKCCLLAPPTTALFGLGRCWNSPHSLDEFYVLSCQKVNTQRL